jgi:L-alanine-DL-glutamate epimerase-like enolase superfamily enzyme
VSTVQVVVERAEAVPVRIPATFGAYEAVIVVLHGDGVTGVGEAPATAGRGYPLQRLTQGLAEALEDPGSVRPELLPPPARAAVEMARLDLDARAAGVPVAQLIGGVRREGVTCSYLVPAERPAPVAAEVEAAVAEGFRVFKLKAANKGGVIDLERLGAAHWAAGPGAELRLDMNGKLTPGEADVVSAGMVAARVALLEQPLPPAASLADWLHLMAAAKTVIAADESLADPSLASQLAQAGVALAIKLAGVGGLRPALALARVASGPLCVGSSYETSIGLAAAVHVACALEKEPLACGLATLRLLDGDLASGLDLRGPCARVGAGPGLGVELDRAALARYRVDK